MRVSQQEKDRTHERIVSSAARLLRERGIEGASVADVMTDAGLTHGGFYRHFDSKDALVAAALESAFGEIERILVAHVEGPELDKAADSFQQLYLSDEHVGSREFGCPAVALGGDVARGSAALKAQFGAGVSRMISKLAKALTGTPAARRKAAARRLAMMAGAVMIARASDPVTAHEVLVACRSHSTAVEPTQ